MISIKNREDGMQYVYFFIALILIGFTGWYYTRPSRFPQGLSHEILLRLPDHIVTELNMTEFNTEGFPARRFHVKELIHFPTHNLSQFKKPYIVLYPDKGKPWVIQSDEGEAENGTTKITLLNHVIMHQNAYENETEKTITTDEITYYTQNDFAETKKMIFFEQPGLRIQSLGMKAYLKKQQIELSQQVWSEYINNEKP